MPPYSHSSLITHHSSLITHHSEQLEPPATAEHRVAQAPVHGLFPDPDAQERAEEIVARNRQHVLAVDVDARTAAGDEIDVHHTAALEHADLAHHAIQVAQPGLDQRELCGV